jgi:hypothetical protein
MARTGPEVADVLRRYGDAYGESRGAALCTAIRAGRMNLYCGHW